MGDTPVQMPHVEQSALSSSDQSIFDAPTPDASTFDKKSSTSKPAGWPVSYEPAIDEYPSSDMCTESDDDFLTDNASPGVVLDDHDDRSTRSSGEWSYCREEDLICPQKLGGMREYVYDSLTSAKGLHGRTMEDLIADISINLQMDGEYVPHEIDLLVDALVKTSHVHPGIDTLQIRSADIRGREYSTAHFNYLCHAPTPLKCLPTDLKEESTAIIVISRYSSELHGYSRTRRHCKHIMKTYHALFGQGRSPPAEFKAETSDIRECCWMPLVLRDVDASISMRDMIDCSTKGESRRYLERLNKWASSRGVQPLVTFLLPGLDAGSVNNNSYHELLAKYPHLRFRLTIAIVSNPDQNAQSQFASSKALLSYFRPFCTHSASSKFSHIEWAFYDVARLAHLYPSQATADDGWLCLYTADYEHALNKAHKQLLLANLYMMYDRIDKALSLDNPELDILRGQTQLGDQLSRTLHCLGAAFHNCDLACCSRGRRCSQDCHTRRCRWCQESADTVCNWRFSSVPPLRPDDPLTRYVCDKQTCWEKEEHHAI